MSASEGARDGEETGQTRAALERAGTLIGSYDLLIASQARRRGALLAAANIRELSRVPDLVLGDWSIPPEEITPAPAPPPP